jgi:3-isopropylmalate/(R)-2-methylmalate dehydratase small subunit
MKYMAAKTISGTAVPFIQSDINTDRLMPGDWLMRGHSEGFGVGLFAEERYIANGKDNPDFILNRKPWNTATILLAGRNFGCGSTREEAPLALRAFGFRCVIAPSFPAVFFANCFRNGVLAVVMPPEKVAALADLAERSGGHAIFDIDLHRQVIIPPEGESITFQSPPKLLRMLIEGTDEIGLTLGLSEQIEAFRKGDRKRRPWAYLPARETAL